MWLFGKRKKTVPELEEILHGIEVNANNNYKDNVRDGLKDFAAKLAEMTEAGALSDAQRTAYEEKLTELQKTYTGYFHTEQKATWH